MGMALILLTGGQTDTPFWSIGKNGKKPISGKNIRYTIFFEISPQTWPYCSRTAGQMSLLGSLIHGPTPRKDRTSIGRNSLAHPTKHQILGTQSGMFERTWTPQNDQIFFFEIHVPGHLFRMGDAFGAFLGHMIFLGRVTLTHPL